MRKLTVGVGTLAMVGCLTLAAGAAQGVSSLAPLRAAPADGIANEYIVRVVDGVNPATIAEALGVTPTHVYDTVLNGFAVRLDSSKLNQTLAKVGILGVEQDALARINVVSWGQDRLDQTDLPLDKRYNTTARGAGVNAYVIDSGIQADHPEFAGRAKVAYDATGGDGADCNGHGTHVAGTIGGENYGVAPQVGVNAVRVLGCDGAGPTSDIIAGMDWVAKNAIKPAVANISIGGAPNSSFNAAANKLAQSGVFVAVSAGNDRKDASSESPAAASGVFAVAASDSSDTSASFTDFGPLVKLYAPGVDIKSAWLNSGTKTISGTSMAAPHVVGVAALYKGAKGDATQSVLTDWLQSNASKTVIKGARGDTTTDLLQTGGL